MNLTDSIMATFDLESGPAIIASVHGGTSPEMFANNTLINVNNLKFREMLVLGKVGF